ncbi:10955_t:CDS:2, partial [Gigaspora margarita]
SDQFEYDEWYKIGRFLNTAMMNKDCVLIGKVQDVAATRVFMLRVAKKEVPDHLQKISSRVDSKPKALVSSFSNSSGARSLLALVQKSKAYGVNYRISKETSDIFKSLVSIIY